jgi:hypothetical protein
VHIGNFVEVKNSTLARGAKANHLAYLGDAQVGERVNYGAGSITANYDGANKHRTVIEDDVHVGSNCVLVAPVRIGKGGTIGAVRWSPRHGARRAVGGARPTGQPAELEAAGEGAQVTVLRGAPRAAAGCGDRTWPGAPRRTPSRCARSRPA